MQAVNSHMNLTEILDQSEMLRDIRYLERDRESRPLTEEEVSQLLSNQNRSDSWEKIRVTQDFNAHRIYACEFIGDVYLGCFREGISYKNTRLKSGLAYSTIQDAVIEDNVVVRNVEHLSCVCVGTSALVIGAGFIGSTKKTSFGSGIEIGLGNKTIQEKFMLCAELPYATARQWMDEKTYSLDFRKEYRECVRKYSERLRCSRSYICQNAKVLHVDTLENVFIGAYACVENGSVIRESTLLSCEDEAVIIGPHVLVEKSIVQWGSVITSASDVDHCAVLEHAKIEHHARVTQSLIAPNTIIELGEVNTSYLGPFVGLHHRALMIATTWLDGKGNVAHGANVGSNHSGRAPDQELWASEGLFFGLGCNIRFPSHFMEAPYLFIAAGLEVPSQKVRYPFSLMRRCLGNIGRNGCENELLPGWVLSENLYGLERNRQKWGQRNEAKRSMMNSEFLHPGIVEGLLGGLKRLESIKEEKEFYENTDIDGLGKNVLTEIHRKQAVDTYTFFTKYYFVWSYVLELLLLKGGAGTKGDIFQAEPVSDHWKFSQGFFEGAFKTKEHKEIIKIWAYYRSRYEKTVTQSRNKDYSRGEKLMPHFHERFGPLEEDPIVTVMKKESNVWEQILEKG
ncbi:DUF4954 family protein [PVC group bacterium]|nr:DUF4954 family protein [PVC group bacterium]